MVCNTGPLIALSIINGLDILRSLFGEVIVPETVHQEIMKGGSFNAGLANYLKADWIKVMTISTQLDPLLITFLDVGEAEVIGLAIEMKADFVLIDERKGRKIARTIYNLRVIGSARVLVEAKRNKLLSNVGGALETIRSGGYWIHDDIVNVILRESEEK